jgi:predicted solute-binding protein
LVVSAQGDNPRNNHRKEKEKVYVSAGEWRMIMSAINHDTGIPADSRREFLMGYQYALHQHKKKLLQEKSELRRSHESNRASSRS